MPFARLIQGFVGIAAGDFGGVTNHDENPTPIPVERWWMARAWPHYA